MSSVCSHSKRMSFEWSEKEGKFTMFNEEENKDAKKTAKPGNKKKIKEGNLILQTKSFEAKKKEQNKSNLMKKSK